MIKKSISVLLASLKEHLFKRLDSHVDRVVNLILYTVYQVYHADFELADILVILIFNVCILGCQISFVWRRFRNSGWLDHADNHLLHIFGNEIVIIIVCD